MPLKRTKTAATAVMNPVPGKASAANALPTTDGLENCRRVISEMKLKELTIELLKTLSEHIKNKKR